MLNSSSVLQEVTRVKGRPPAASSHLTFCPGVMVTDATILSQLFELQLLLSPLSSSPAFIPPKLQTSLRGSTVLTHLSSALGHLCFYEASATQQLQGCQL